jgi:hypothetical protein
VKVVAGLTLQVPGSPPAPISLSHRAVVAKGKISNHPSVPAEEAHTYLIDRIPAKPFFERKNLAQTCKSVRSALSLDASPREPLLSPVSADELVAAAACNSKSVISRELVQEALEVIGLKRDVAVNLCHDVNLRWKR